ncbi:Mitochondrial pyruvate carrier 2 [Entomophthora muscae]|uniref:Mitochondrial pyruvate carrier 2 n=1 Tax=Entomophthora muscae TaxID=34485 RepID=A0ACC2UAI7_9FUNG|nr:Mitochondrial pyruvate carrier 2 [Entomophthora muscae]
MSAFFSNASFQSFLNHPAGPRTVHFWAPAFKWGLVIAGLSDLSRPVDKISLSQTGALTATGLIWSRYSLVIKPKNYGLFSVNMFVAATGLYQLYRVYSFTPQATEGSALLTAAKGSEKE